MYNLFNLKINITQINVFLNKNISYYLLLIQIL